MKEITRLVEMKFDGWGELHRNKIEPLSMDDEPDGRDIHIIRRNIWNGTHISEERVEFTL